MPTYRVGRPWFPLIQKANLQRVGCSGKIEFHSVGIQGAGGKKASWSKSRQRSRGTDEAVDMSHRLRFE